MLALIGQGYYAGHRTLPHFLDQDASGVYGPEDAPLIRVVALGDSCLTGPGLLDTSDLWIRQIFDRLPYRFDLRVLAKGGAWMRDVVDDQLPEALQLKPDIALVSGGSNDSIRGARYSRLRRDLTYIAGSLAEVASTVALVGVGDMGTIPRLPQPLASFARLRSHGADRVHQSVARRHTRIVHIPMWDEASGPFREHGRALFTNDQFHPNARGQTVWADLGFPVITAAAQRIVAAR
jgi:lysophospholipase L1-like esterase